MAGRFLDLLKDGAIRPNWKSYDEVVLALRLGKAKRPLRIQAGWLIEVHANQKPRRGRPRKRARSPVALERLIADGVEIDPSEIATAMKRGAAAGPGVQKYAAWLLDGCEKPQRIDQPDLFSADPEPRRRDEKKRAFVTTIDSIRQRQRCSVERAVVLVGFEGAAVDNAIRRYYHAKKSLHPNDSRKRRFS